METVTKIFIQFRDIIVVYFSYNKILQNLLKSCSVVKKEKIIHNIIAERSKARFIFIPWSSNKTYFPLPK